MRPQKHMQYVTPTNLFIHTHAKVHILFICGSRRVCSYAMQLRKNAVYSKGHIMIMTNANFLFDAATRHLFNHSFIQQMCFMVMSEMSQ
jgi:hypothetical protein